MLNDDQDKDAMRRQSVFLVIMLLMFWGWFTYFGPKPQPPAPTKQQTIAPGAAAAAIAPDAAASPASVEETQKAAAWPFLPAVPGDFTPATDEVTIRDADLELVFTRIGARLKRATVLLGENGAGNVQLVPQPAADTPDTKAVYPLGLQFSAAEIGDGLDSRRFDYVLDPNGRGVSFSLELPGAATIRKNFQLGGAHHVVDVSIEYQNREDAPRIIGVDQIPAYVLNWGPGVVDNEVAIGLPPKFVWRRSIGAEVLDPKKLPPANGDYINQRVPGVSWIGYKTLYFFAAMRPAGDDPADGSLQGTPDNFRFGLGQPKFEVAPGQVHTAAFRLYLGPMHLGDLSQAWPTLTTALRFYGPGGWFGDTVSDLMDWFAKLLLKNLNWWHSFVPNYGVAIILLTVLVRMVVFPLTIKSIRSMKKMQALQPEMAALKEKFPDNPQELQRAMMLMYKERKINPLAGCLPIFFQMPVFFALYRMLWYAFELRGADFLWIKDLSQPDRMFHFPALHNLPLLGDNLEYFNLLPLLVCAGMMLSFRLMPQTGPSQNPQQKMMMNLMPIIFTVFGYQFAAGLNLYVFTSTILGIAQNYLVRVTDIGGPPVALTPAPAGGAPDGKKPAETKVAAPSFRRKKPQHFYDRAQQRKREMAKADKKRPKKK